MTKAEVGQDFARPDSSELPAAYVVQVKDLARIKGFKSLTVDRGIKHKAKGLSKLLLGQKKVPVIDGNFSDAGQLRRSVRTLLANAEGRGERNLYIVGAPEAIFKTIWDQAVGPVNRSRSERNGQGNPEPDRQAPRPASRPSREPDRATGLEITSRLLDMLDLCEVPAELVHRFKGQSAKARLVRQFIVRAAQSEVRVLILGETGTGKEVVARAIHDLSGRSREKLTTVN